MTTAPCLDEVALESLAHGRRDLVSPDALAHARSCPRCGAALEEARALSVAFAAELADPARLDEAELGALVSQALESGLDRTREARLRVVAAAGACILLAALLSVLSLVIAMPSAGELLETVRETLAVASAARRVLELLPAEGTSAVAFGLSAALLVIALSWSRLAARARAAAGSGGLGLGGTLGLVLLLGGGALVSQARALELRGRWDDAPRVTVEIDRRPRTEALRAVAQAAGLDLVASLRDDAGPPVEVHVREAPLGAVLRAVLGDGPFVAERDGGLLVVREDATPAPPGSPATPDLPPPGGPGAEPPEETPPAAGAPGEPSAPRSPSEGPTTAPPSSGSATPSAPPAPPEVAPAAPPAPPPPPVPPTPPAPPAPAGPLSDRVATGGNVVVRAGERVRDAVALGGDVRVEGEVVGDAVATGGDVRVVAGGSVGGNVTAMGGDIVVEPGAAVSGATVSMGGEVRIEPGAQVQGTQVRTDRTSIRIVRGEADAGSVRRWVSGALGRAARYALLLLLGLVLAGATPERFAALQRTIVKQPVRTVATGLLALLASTFATIALAVTVVGLPGAIVVALLVVVSIYLGLAASASVIGAILPLPFLRHRPVLQLAAGVLVLLLASFIPGLGGIVVAAAAIIGAGAVVSTRFSARAPSD